MKLDKNLGFQIGIITLMLIQIICLSFFNEYLIIGVIGAITWIAYKVLPKDPEKRQYSKESLLIIASGILAYYVITYLLGFFIGFVYTTYSKSLMGIVKNVGMYTALVVEIEYVRYILVDTGKRTNQKNYLLVATTSLIEIATVFSFQLIESKTGLLESFLGNVLPIISLNILLTYLATKTDKKNALLAHLGLNLPIYVLPVFPNLGDYLRTLILMVLPILILVALDTTLFYKKEKGSAKTYKRDKIIERITQVCALSLLVIVIYFVTGVGRFSTFAIGSISMTPVIGKGDIVIIDTKIKEYEIGDIIAFDKEGKKIVHRIANVQKNGNKTYYVTKGDANETNDDWIVREEELIGQYKFRLIGLGWPTVSLSELLAE